MSRYLKQVSLLMMWALLVSFSLCAQAQEAPGALTFVVKNQKTDRPLSGAQIILRERRTNTTQTVENDEQGGVVVEGLPPGLYAVRVTQSGFAPASEPSLRVVTRKNIIAEFALVEQAIERLVVQGQRADAYTSGSNIYIDREGLRSAVGGGGRFSIFAPNVISGAEFSPGGWSAAYGGRAASLLKLDVARGNPSPSASLSCATLSSSRLFL